MPKISEQVEWLSLIDISGPFLAASVLEEAFPQGLDKIETPRRQRLRSAYDEWRDAVDDEDPQLEEMHAAWVRMVLEDMLEYEQEILIDRRGLNGQCVYQPAEHAPISPDYAVRSDDGKLRLLVLVCPPGTDLEKPNPKDAWPASPIERTTFLCRNNDLRVGLVTDGERWVIVNAPLGATSGYAGWLARLWWQEPVTLKAFQSLLGVRRCFGPREESLGALFERSVAFQEEVTDTLGEQVRRAVEILVQAIGRVDQDRDGNLLKEIQPAELYEAGLTMMMRLVFTLCAEERGLLLLGDPIYDQYYAISTLRARLREDADSYGIEVLERRHDAWSRLLAVFRAIFAGVEHETLRMPALGGSLFDPDRFPFLEGRPKGTTWRIAASLPLPIDNRTVLMLLDALQVLEQRRGAQLLSYRALDVEQLGHVYEGLLEYTVAKLESLTVGLIGSRKVRHPAISVDELERLLSQGNDKTVERLVELTGRSSTAIGSALKRGCDEAAFLRLISASHGDEKIARRLLPFAELIRSDSWGAMLVYRPGSFSIIPGTSRRSTGTHYTPKSLTEPIIQHTLEPLVYHGPAEGKPREEWRLKAPAELLELKICDMAMGSAAFLVQACRFLGERITEAWAANESAGKVVSAEGVVLDDPSGVDLITKDKSDRLLIARRLVASRCLYGVDINPMAVELGKLSLWLVTMMRNRPFGFLDHALKCGDSLLGTSSAKQIEAFSIKPDGKQITFATAQLSKLIDETAATRRALESLPSNDYEQIAAKNRLHLEAEAATIKLKILADRLIVFELRGLTGRRYDEERMRSAAHTEAALETSFEELRRSTAEELKQYRTFHWPVEFPEVFSRGGFDAFIGNPPFMGGRWVNDNFGGDYRRFVYSNSGAAGGNCDISVLFVLRAMELLMKDRYLGLITTKTSSEGDSRKAGLLKLLSEGKTIYRASAKLPWPGSAAVLINILHLVNGKWNGAVHLDNTEVPAITSELEAGSGTLAGEPYALVASRGLCLQGSLLRCMAFIISDQEATALLEASAANNDVVKRFLDGDDLNGNSRQTASRWVIDFKNYDLEKAKSYKAAFRLVQERVYPVRMSTEEGKKEYGHMWWQFWRPRAELYAKLSSMREAMVVTLHTKYLTPTFVAADQVFSHALGVLPTEDRFMFALLHSSLFEAWARLRSGSLGVTLRFTPTECLENFPLIAPHTELRSAAVQYERLRGQLLRELNIGLTELYNRFHDSHAESEQIVQLRNMHAEIDRTMAAAYGWKDVDLAHDFRETKQGLRYTICESARRTFLDRFLSLNQRHHEDELRSGLSGGKRLGRKSAKQISRTKENVDG